MMWHHQVFVVVVVDSVARSTLLGVEKPTSDLLNTTVVFKHKKVCTSFERYIRIRIHTKYICSCRSRDGQAHKEMTVRKGMFLYVDELCHKHF